MNETLARLWATFMRDFPKAIWETLYTCVLSTALAFALGLVLAILLILTARDGLRPMPRLYRVLDILTNTLRSFPFIILIIAIAPLTKLLVGTSIGTTATIVPLTIGAAPFIARLLESAFREVDSGMIEAARSFGASDAQIIFRIMFVEALPSIVSAITMTLIVIIGFSAMAGAVGGGGLGALAINRGYNGFNKEILYMCVVVLLVIVQICQSVGDFIYKKIKK